MIYDITQLLEKMRAEKPLVHHITNYVTVNDCANVTLGIGASPIMADSFGEAADIAGISKALVLNIGTLNERTVPSMLSAGEAANACGVPVVFDPVGAGASGFRNKTAALILDTIKISVLRGNISEIRYLSGLSSKTKGVDAADSDLSAQDDVAAVTSSAAKKYGCVVAVTGAVDVISDGKRVLRIANGHPMLSALTGTGCMCSSLIGSFCGVAPNDPLTACAAALLVMGISGELAYERAGAVGNGSFRVALHDAVSRMDAEILTGRAKLYEA